MSADDLVRLLDELGQRLGPTGEYVFALAVRQVYVDAAIYIGAWLVVVIALAIVARPLYWWTQDGDSYSDRGLMATLGAMCAGFVLVGLTVAALLSLASLLNPEYAALRSILGSVRPQ